MKLSGLFLKPTNIQPLLDQPQMLQKVWIFPFIFPYMKGRWKQDGDSFNTGNVCGKYNGLLYSLYTWVV